MNELETLQDHEKRIRRLEESDIEQRMQLASIEKSQAEIKLMINENSKEQQKTLNEFTEKIVTTFTSNITEDNKTKNKIKFYNTKEFWAITAAVVTAVVAYFSK
ncbi:hypothetical protein N4T77_19975 [Clostridium sp. CX1]|uniref:hypothetical protein n=1 Tax=Clostridium sp. CX1 TaxID=2978346 RepID=UPI0021BDF629|nr:hypothetical protein [Clostridium sp. CX1]MCT8978859.1 hypothetical protein [Clostridium sp. CX1]